MKAWLTRSFGRQVGILLFSTTTLLVGGYAYLDYEKEHQLWHEIVQTQASELMHMLALSSANDLRYQRNYELWDKVKRVMARQNEFERGRLYRLREIAIIDNDGNVASHTDPMNNPLGRPYTGTLPSILPAADGTDSLTTSVEWQPAREEGFRGYTTITFGGEVIGYVAADFDATPLHEKLEHRYQGYLLYLPLILIVTILMTWAFSRWVAAPLKQLTALLDHLGKGDITIPTLTTRQDEYGTLGRAFEYADKRIRQDSDSLQQRHNELVTAQAALNQFKSTLDQTLDCVFMYEPKRLHFNYVNRGALEQIGYSADELLEMTPVDIKPEFDETRFRQMIAPLISGEQQSLTFETIHRHKNGQLIPVEIFLQYVTLPDEPGRFVAIVRDITERKRVEKELEGYRNHLEELVRERTAKIREQASIIDQAQDAIITTDLNGQITSWNGGAELLFGVPERKAIGRNLTFVYDEREHKNLLQEAQEHLTTHGNYETEIRMDRANGSEFFARLSLSPLYDENDNPIGLICYCIDISERKEREAMLRTLNTRLQSVNRELEAFSYSVSHDLRAPLRAIDGFSLALLEDFGDRLDDAGQDYLNRIRNGAQKMGHLIDDLLQLSRVTRSELQLKRIELGKLAASIIEELRQGDPERNVKVIIAPDLWTYGDPTLLHVLLANLLSNAWKFTRKQPDATIEIGTSIHEGEKNFFIRDNGAGFDMKYAPKLFIAFQRLHPLEQFEGTGIGLATVQRVIAKHGGKIWVEATPNKGATFYFSFPTVGEIRHKKELEQLHNIDRL